MARTHELLNLRQQINEICERKDLVENLYNEIKKRERTNFKQMKTAHVRNQLSTAVAVALIAIVCVLAINTSIIHKAVEDLTQSNKDLLQRVSGCTQREQELIKQLNNAHEQLKALQASLMACNQKGIPNVKN